VSEKETRELTREERALRDRFPEGRRVKFFDDGEAVEPGRVATAWGIVNGDPIHNPSTGTAWIPLWCERSGGRNPTTIYVDIGGIADD
jgi:hypothetical protein